jgi:hypothetical protein
MKRTLLPAAVLAISFVLSAGFIRLHRNGITKAVAAKSPPSSPQAVMVRRNIYSLTAAQITSLKNGIAAMKALPYTNPTSWDYQAAIHGTTRPDNLQSWNSCKHGSPFFLSWHRMYLYYFERILRAKAGDPTLTLPYWDYQSNPVLPPAYEDPTPGNPLYDGTRNSSINSGGSLPNSIMVEFSTILSDATDIPYYTFSSDLEGPHGSVHTAIGGNMAFINSSALDPCFWLHHANIDRLWDVWLRNCGGRSDPSDNAYLTQQYTFFDETGSPVVMTGQQVINTAASLNYIYDFPFKLPCNFRIQWPIWKWIRIPCELWPPLPIPIGEKTVVLNTDRTRLETFNSFLTTFREKEFHFSKSDISDQLFLEFEDLTVEKLPEGAIEVYVNLPAGQAPSEKSRSFAGVLNLFNASMKGHHMEAMTGTSINITTVVQRLGIKPSELSRIKLTFHSRGIALKGREINTSPSVKIGKLTLVVQKAQL